MKWEVSILLLFLVNFAAADIYEEAKAYSQQVMDFIGNDTVVVVGEHLSKSERLAMGYIKEKYPKVAELPVFSDSASEEELLGKTVILIGGPTQNKITANVLAGGGEVRHENLSLGILSFVTNLNGSRFLVFSDKAGYGNVQKNSEHSPLARYVPVQYVPALATAIALSLLWLWHFLLKLLRRILRLFVSSKLMRFARKREFKKKYKGFKLAGLRFKYREWISIILSALVFALAVSYSYVSTHTAVFAFVLSNLLVNIVIYAIRHLTRLVMDRVHKLHTEFVFWFWGGLVTMISGWLGNTFAMAGYMVSDRETKKEAQIQYVINFLSFLASLVFLVWNLVAPSIILQMSMVLAMSIAVIQMLPMNPFSGRIIYRWSRWRWWISFLPMMSIYLLVNVVV